jgi:hypothetical protein
MLKEHKRTSKNLTSLSKLLSPGGAAIPTRAEDNNYLASARKGDDWESAFDSLITDRSISGLSGCIYASNSRLTRLRTPKTKPTSPTTRYTIHILSSFSKRTGNNGPERPPLAAVPDIYYI